METGDPFKISACDCSIRDIACKLCSTNVGYHIVDACRECLNSENNGHYWMFNKNIVTSGLLGGNGIDLFFSPF